MSDEINCFGRYHAVMKKDARRGSTIEPIEPCPTISLADFRVRFIDDSDLDTIYSCERCVGSTTPTHLIRDVARLPNPGSLR